MLDNNNNNVSCIFCVKFGVVVIFVECGFEVVVVLIIYEEVNEVIFFNFKKIIVYVLYIII